MGKPNSTSNPTPNPSTHSSTPHRANTRKQTTPSARPLTPPPTHKPYAQPMRGYQTPTPVQSLPHPSPNNRTNTRTHNINILQLNIHGIRNKIEQLTHFMNTNNIHIALLQETRLRQTHKTPAIKHNTPRRRDRMKAGANHIYTSHY